MDKATLIINIISMLATVASCIIAVKSKKEARDAENKAKNILAEIKTIGNNVSNSGNNSGFMIGEMSGNLNGGMGNKNVK